jgi:hypothetical protein
VIAKLRCSTQKPVLLDTAVCVNRTELDKFNFVSSCAYEASKRMFYFQREQCTKTVFQLDAPVLRMRYLDILSKNIVYFEDTFYIRYGRMGSKWISGRLAGGV